jgi:hypothetical protein
MYGRLRAEHAAAFVASRRAGAIGNLDRFRGRCSYDRPTQAAEIILRRRLGEQAPDALQWLTTIPESKSIWEARFRSATAEQVVRLQLVDTGATRPASCGGKPEPVMEFVEL